MLMNGEWLALMDLESLKVPAPWTMPRCKSQRYGQRRLNNGLISLPTHLSIDWNSIVKLADEVCRRNVLPDFIQDRLLHRAESERKT